MFLSALSEFGWCCMRFGPPGVFLTIRKGGTNLTMKIKNLGRLHLNSKVFKDITNVAKYQLSVICITYEYDFSVYIKYIGFPTQFNHL